MRIFLGYAAAIVLIGVISVGAIAVMFAPASGVPGLDEPASGSQPPPVETTPAPVETSEPTTEIETTTSTTVEPTPTASPTETTVEPTPTASPTETTVSDLYREDWPEYLSIGIQDDATPAQRSAVKEAIEYWTDHPEYGSPDVEYRWWGVNNDSDIQVHFENQSAVEDDCIILKNVDNLKGCYDGSAEPELKYMKRSSPEIYSVEDLARWKLVVIMKHEIGHSRGLDHCDEPSRIMDPNGELCEE